MAAGSIILDLLLRTGSFETDTKRAEKRLQEFEKTAKRVGTAVGLALVGAGTAMAGLTKNAIDQADEMSKLAQKVGLSTEEISRLAYAGDLADVSLGDLQSSMGRLIKGMGDALNKTSAQARIFDALGISVTDASGKMRSANDVLEDFADAFKEQEGSPEIIAAGMEIFGRSFQTLIPLLKDGSEGLREAFTEADKLGVTLSTKTGEQAEAFNDNLTRLQKAAGGLALQVASDLLPDLEALTDRFVDVVTEGDGVSNLAHNIAQGFRMMESAAESSITLVSGIAEVVGGLVTQLQGFYEIAVSLATFDWERRNSGAMTYRRGGAQIDRGVDRLVDPHGPNGLFRDTPTAPASAYNGPLLKPSQAVADAEFEAEVRAIKEAREHAQRLREALGDVLPDKPTSLKGVPDAARESARALKELLSEDRALYEQSIANVDVQTDAITAWGDLTAQLEGPTAEAYRNHLKRLQEITELGQAAGATADEIAAAKARETAAYEASTPAMLEAAEAERQAMAESARLLDSMGFAAEDMFASFIDGSKSASDAFADFAEELQRIAARLLAQKAITWFLGMFFGPAGSAAGTIFDLYSGADFGFASGGYTGPGGKNEPAGIVHAGEYVINAESTKKLGLGFLDSLNGYSQGGAVVPVTRGMALPAGVGGGASSRIEIVNNGAPMQIDNVEQRRGNDGQMLTRIILSTVSKGIAGGELDKVAGQSWGLQRLGVARG